LLTTRRGRGRSGFGCLLGRGGHDGRAVG
jgi:hypothetical protein